MSAPEQAWPVRNTSAPELEPERFDPAHMPGQLVAAEHILRYWFACRFCVGARVLDAGCGTGYGAAMLKRAGASEVVAVDTAEPILDAVRPNMPDGVACEVADVTALPYADDSFQLAVCFEVIEHVETPDRALDELARVLTPNGLLLISSPNRDRYVPGNPHHRREFLPSELRAALEKRFARVRLFQQHVMVASVLTAGGESNELAGVQARREVLPSREDEMYTVAMAGDSLPEPGGPMVDLTHFLELRRWLTHFAEQARILDEQAAALREMEAVRQDRLQALDLLAGREQDLAEAIGASERTENDAQAQARRYESRIGALQGEIAELEAQIRRREDDASELQRRVQRAEQVLDGMRHSASWRLTAPLRWLKRQRPSSRKGLQGGSSGPSV